ncbi:MAG: hypothetical protein K5639_02830 [Eubacterium sp.]|nr:hypothetical protein [Eubacterium sp.]
MRLIRKKEKTENKETKSEKKKNNKSSVGQMVLKIKPLKTLLFSDKKTIEYVKAINPRDDPEKSLAALWEARLGIIVVLLAAVIFMFVYCFTSDENEGFLSSNNVLTRAEDDEEIELFVSGKNDNEVWEEKLDLDLASRRFTDEEKEKIDKKTDAFVGDKLLGENLSTDHIKKKLDFVSVVPGTEVELKWTYDTNYVSDSGEIIREGIPETGVDTEVMVKASWKNFEQTYHYPLHIDPPVYTQKELAIRAASQAVSGAVTDQATEEKVMLPTEYKYREEKPGKSYMPVFVAIFTIAMMPFLWKETQKKKMNERQNQMLLDHPGFINKVMLLLGAGLTFRGAIERMTAEYEKQKNESKEIRYIYEELCITMQEMKDGISETKAIENFGKRVLCMPYMRFASIISQNLKKGSDGILTLLEKEAVDSLEERKQTALRLGEVAGTKLLFPMIVMLGLVMGIIMVPAFMSM